MRAAGAIVGLLVLGSFVIPSPYGPKTEHGSTVLGPGPSRPGEALEREAGTATVGGRVFDGQGNAVEGAVVSLAGSGFWPARSVATDADGRFDWPDIPVGIYELRVSRGRWVAPPLEGLVLDAGARRSFGFQLLRGWIAEGRVVDASTGTPIRGAEVTMASGALGLHVRRTETGASGRFAITGAVGDAQTLYVEAPGYLMAGPLTVAAGAPPARVALNLAAQIEGRVVDEGGRPVSGASVRAFGESTSGPVGGSFADSLGVTSGPVPPISAAGTGSLAFAAQTVTGPDGRFTLGGLRPGPHTIAATHRDFAPAESESVRLRAGVTRDGVDVVLFAGAELTGRVVDERGVGLESIPVELRTPTERLPRMSVTASDGSFSFRGVRGELTVTALPYDLPPARTNVTIADEALVAIELRLGTALETMRGRVVDERGVGVGGALVVVTSPDPASPVRRTAKSDSDGTFSVPALPAPPYDVKVEHPAFSEARVQDVESPDDVRIALTTGVTFLGEVLDGWSGEGLGGVRVGLEGPLRTDTRTRRDGTFVFRQLPTGTYEVSLSHPDYEDQERRVVLEPPRFVDRPQELGTVRLSPGGMIEGEIVDVRGVPVAGAEVAWGDPPRWESAVRTNATGTFQLQGVRRGAVWVTARDDAAGEASSPDPVYVKPLESSPGVVIRLPDAAAE